MASAGKALGQANFPIYTNGLVNDFQDWSWGTRNLANTNPVLSGSYSISASYVAWQGLSFHAPDFNTSLYSNVTFWANGGSTGGQILQVYAQLDNTNPLPTVVLTPLPTNSWGKFTVSCSALGLSTATNFNRITFQLTSNGTTNEFYLDDIQFNAKPAPSLVHLNANANSPVRSADQRWFGINTAMWDANLDTPQTITLLQQMGTRALRCMGGSLSDEYHWASNTALTNTWTWSSSFADLTQVATNVGAQIITTVNYGTGSSNEAAAWVAYANGSTTNTMSLGTDPSGANWQTVGYWASLRASAPLAHDDGRNFLRISRPAPLGFTYWEIGNECYGSWEVDSNSLPHDPYTYAVRAKGYLNLMRAVDSAIKIGVVATPGETSYSNYPNHFAINPRTGNTNYGWTPVMLANLTALGATPDFLINHGYPAGDSDPLLMQYAGGVNGWASDAASLRQMLTDYLGAPAANVELCVTENNTLSSGKQLTSLVNGLYLADSFCQLAKTEFNSYLWWDLRNGVSSGDNDPTLYGWRLYGDEGVIANLTNCYPTFYAFKLLQYFVQPGDTILNASSDYLLLSAYAAHRTNGALSLLVLNKDTTANFSAQVTLAGFVPYPTATIRSYGVPQDDSAQTNGATASEDIATNTFSAATTNFNYSFPPLSLTLFTFSPPAPRLVVLPPAPRPGAQFVFQLQGQPGQYYIQTSTNAKAGSWTTVSTNWLAGASLTISNPVPAGPTISLWRALWQP